MRKTLVLVLLCACSLSVAASAQRRRAGGAGSSKTVAVSNFQFAPRSVTVKAGGTVTWSNNEGTHTVTADDDSWESPTLKAGQTFSRRFDRPGTYPYHCSFHGSPGGHMSGVVNVVR